jgi:hypothetical protein
LATNSVTRAARLVTAFFMIAGLGFVSLSAFGPHGGTQSAIGHSAEHVLAFAVLALLLLPLARSREQKWMVVLAVFTVGVGLEIRQHQLFRQPFEWWDVRDDGIGIALAWLLVRKPRWKAIPVAN